MRWHQIAVALLVAQGRMALADSVDNRLESFEVEVRKMQTDLAAPPSAIAANRTVVDGIIAYELGEYDRAAGILLDQLSQGAQSDLAVFYMGETLFAKGDVSSSAGYYARLTTAQNLGNKYYQPSLLRLVEISIARGESADQPLALLDQIAPGQRAPNVNYVKAKYAFSQKQFDQALADLGDVPKGALDFQVQYYTGVISVAKQDYQRAIEVYTDLIEKKPKTAADRRVVELGQLALGRLYYERDQFSRSIDSYLLVDRHSDLFPSALYEVSWVYVKNKQYDKALKALDLLATSNPTATNTPTVRLLEGNLHIRKAQRLREALINGTLETTEKDDPHTEYASADQAFDQIKNDYQASYDTMSKVLEANIDPAQYLAQISDRDGDPQNQLSMPELAINMLREEPDVERLVEIEKDLGDIQHSLEQTQNMITRIQGVLANGDTSTLYPLLAQKRHRAFEIEDALIPVRNDLAEQQERGAVDGNVANLQAKRRELYRRFAAMGNVEQAYTERRLAARRQVDDIEKRTGEITTALDSTHAMDVAIRKFANSNDPKVTPEAKQSALKQLDSEAGETKSIQGELPSMQTEIDLLRDQAGMGDTEIAAARALRRQLLDAQTEELNALAQRGSSGLVTTSARSNAVVAQLRAVEETIDRHVAENIAKVKTELVTDVAQLDQYKGELAIAETEAKSLGTASLSGAFRNVKSKLDDIVIRADVGTIDTSWSQKSDTDDDLKRLNLSRAREMKQLRDEFRDILEANQPKSTKKAPVSDLPASTGQATSPDKGGTNTRVAPIGNSTTGPAQPTVKPDDTKTAPAPKKGGNK